MNLGPRLKHLDNRRKVLRTAKRKHPMKEKPKISFWKYVTGDKWGRTEWWKFAVIHVAGLACSVWNVFDPMDWPWLLPVFAVVLVGASWWRTWANWKLDRYGLPTSPDNHVNDIVGEGSPDPVWKKGNKPILEFERWVAARYEKPYDTIDAWLHSLPIDQVGLYVEEFDRYLKRRQ